MSDGRTRFSLVVALLLCSGLPALAQAGASTTAEIADYTGPDRIERLIAGAKREGAFTVYTSARVDDMALLGAAFEKKYGVKARVWRASSENVLQRGVMEARGGRFVTPLEGLVRIPRLRQTGPPHPEGERSSDAGDALGNGPAAGEARRRPLIRPIGDTGAFECVECAKLKHTHRQVRRVSARVGRRYGVRVTCRWCHASQFFPRTHDAGSG